MATLVITKRKGARPATRTVDPVRAEQIAFGKAQIKSEPPPKPAEPPPPKPKGEQPPGALLQSVVGALRTAAKREKFIADDEREALVILADMIDTRVTEIREIAQVMA